MNKVLETALSEYGTMEWAEGDNPEVLKYFDSLMGNPTDETAWCSAFMNWCARVSGYEQSGKLNARSWLDVGESIGNPSVGDVVVLWRDDPDSWKGHVGLYINSTNGSINVLGGNQNNRVCIKSYPKHRILGYRRLREAV